MGGKHSSSKKEAGETTQNKGSQRPNQYEEIDDDALIANQKKLTGSRESLDQTKAADHLMAIKEAILKNSPPSDNASSNNSDENKTSESLSNDHKIDSDFSDRFHPYAEISDVKTTIAPKENKEKKNDNTKQKEGKKQLFGHKMKTKQIDGSMEPGLQTHLSDGVSTDEAKPKENFDSVDRFHPYDDICDVNNTSDKKVQKVGKKDKSKSKDKEKGKDINKIKTSDGLNAKSHLIAGKSPDGLGTGKIGQGESVSPELGLPIYAEITKKILHPTGAQECGISEKQTHVKDKSKDKARNNKKNTAAAVNKQHTSGSASSPVSDNENLNSRYHPYDDISEDELTSQRNEIKLEKTKKAKNKEKRCINEVDQPEYLNAAVIFSASSNQSLDNQVSQEESTAGLGGDGRDVYAVPVKTKTKAVAKKELNYVEVEFEQDHHRLQIKASSSPPTLYSNVMARDGKIYLSDC